MPKMPARCRCPIRTPKGIKVPPIKKVAVAVAVVKKPSLVGNGWGKAANFSLPPLNSTTAPKWVQAGGWGTVSNFDMTKRAVRLTKKNEANAIEAAKKNAGKGCSCPNPTPAPPGGF